VGRSLLSFYLKKLWVCNDVIKLCFTQEVTGKLLIIKKDNFWFLFFFFSYVDFDTNNFPNRLFVLTSCVDIVFLQLLTEAQSYTQIA